VLFLVLSAFVSLNPYRRHTGVHNKQRSPSDRRAHPARLRTDPPAPYPCSLPLLARTQARAFARKTLGLALVAGVLLGLLIGGPSSPSCLALMGAGPGSALHPAALSYARVRAFGLPFGMMCSAMEGIFRGRGDTCATAPGGAASRQCGQPASFRLSQGLTESSWRVA
jgi:hypothetical protein